MPASHKAIKVFYSYADADESFCLELERHLILLQRDGIIAPWHKRKVVAGTDRSEIIDEHLNTASVILLFISSDFLASDYCYGTEMQRAIQRHEAGEAHVIPLLVNRPKDRTKMLGRGPLVADCQKALPLCAISFATTVKHGQLALQAGLPNLASEKPDR